MTVATAIGNLSQLAVTSPAVRPRRLGRSLGFLLRLEAWFDERESRRALYRMDARALADIGLTEADRGRDDPAGSWQSLLTGGPSSPAMHGGSA